MVLAGQVGRIALQIGSVAVLARLLTPEDYGIVAIALALVGIGEIFRDAGLSTAAVRAPTLDHGQRTNLFWINTAMGVVLAALAYAASPLVAAAFSTPDVEPVVEALAVTFVINGAAAQYRADLNRRMRFHSLVAVDLGSQLAGTMLAIVVAWRGAGYWALVVQQIVACLVVLMGCVALARWAPGRPQRSADVRPMVRFGMGMLTSQVIGYLNSNVDTLVIGRRLGAQDLGYYNRAYQLVMRPLSQLRSPTTSVALPVLARLSDDVEASNAFLVRSQLALGYTLVPLTAMMAGAAAPLVAVFLGEQWAPVVPIFALLAVAGTIQNVDFVALWVFLGRGLTRHLVWFSLVSLVIKVVCVLVGVHWGVVGVAAGFAIAPALWWPLSIWWLSRVTPMPTGALYSGATRILVCAVAAGCSASLAVRLTAHLSDVLQLCVAAGAAAAAYLAACLVPVIRRDALAVVALGRRGLRRPTRAGATIR